MTKPVQIVDLFSGPGGLSEGFSKCRDINNLPHYRIAISVEKHLAAFRTLRLRAFLRRFDQLPAEYSAWLIGKIEEPDWKKIYPEQWQEAKREVFQVELGEPKIMQSLSDWFTKFKPCAGNRTLMMGGPPCQGYSLAGRSRNAGNDAYRPQEDKRNYLYREYCRLLGEFRPAVFVMENVKGMLSSSVDGKAIFAEVMTDLESAGKGYRLVSLSGSANGSKRPLPQDFVVHTEDYGIPQARHRVIIVGIRSDIVERIPREKFPHLQKRDSKVTVRQALVGLPRLRSGLSRDDNPSNWCNALLDACGLVLEAVKYYYPGKHIDGFMYNLDKAKKHYENSLCLGRIDTRKGKTSLRMPRELAEFFDDSDLRTISCHETRGHMPADLARYLFAASFAKAEKHSPRACHFPSTLAPQHKSWKTGKFNDRFRVQLYHAPSTTVTSHISKDGHYFIHPDPVQCRSLTVREAARLQTFPDNYHFMGNRTEQYVQVGNAVPPFLAKQIAEALLPIFDYV